MSKIRLLVEKDLLLEIHKRQDLSRQRIYSPKIVPVLHFLIDPYVSKPDLECIKISSDE